jgi:hypothetical protein
MTVLVKWYPAFMYTSSDIGKKQNMKTFYKAGGEKNDFPFQNFWLKKIQNHAI